MRGPLGFCWAGKLDEGKGVEARMRPAISRQTVSAHHFEDPPAAALFLANISRTLLAEPAREI
jgi:hypothetical protein